MKTVIAFSLKAALSFILTAIAAAVVLNSAPVTKAQSKAGPRSIWQIESVPQKDGFSLNGISADSPTDVWAIGGSGPGSLGGALHFDGKTWGLIDVPLGTGGIFLNSVVALSPKNVWAVGATTNPTTNNNNELVEHFDGKAWKVIPNVDIVGKRINRCTVLSASLAAITVVSPQDFWVAGNLANDCKTLSAFVQHFDGKSWRFSGQLSDTGVHFAAGTNAISARSDGDIWVAGQDAHVGQAEIWHFDGSQWTLVASPTIPSSNLQSAVAVASDDVWAVGSITQTANFRTLIEHFDGKQWRVARTPSPSFQGQPIDLNLVSIAAISARDIWVAGSYYDLRSKGHALALHWDGSRWSISPTPRNGRTVATYAVSALPQGNIWLGGLVLKGGGPPTEPFVLSTKQGAGR